jgi:hypothetical protein
LRDELAGIAQVRDPALRNEEQDGGLSVLGARVREVTLRSGINHDVVKILASDA